MIFRLLIALTALALTVAGCNERVDITPEPRPKIENDRVFFPPGSRQVSALTVEPVTPGKTGVFRLNGKLAWNENKTVRLFTPFAGRVSKIMVQLGDVVETGQVLAMVASPDFGQAQAEARKAAADFALAEKNLSRLKELYEHGVAPRKDLNAAEAEYARAQTEMQRAAARIKLYGKNGDLIDQLYALRSPLDGLVVEKNINPGQELRSDLMLSNAPPLFVITDPSRLWIQLDATEKDLTNIRRGQMIVIRSPAYPNQAFDAKIVAISDFLDPSTRTIKVRGVVENQGRQLKGEMFVTAEISSDLPVAAQVPEKAVFLNGEKHYVFVEEGAGKYVRREIVSGPEHEGRIDVLSGLEAGQRVVTEGSLMLQQMLLSHTNY